MAGDSAGERGRGGHPLHGPPPRHTRQQITEARPVQSNVVMLPSLRATMFCQVTGSIEYLIERTEPSHSTTLKPAGWAEPKKSHIPASVLAPDGSDHGRFRAVASRRAGLSWLG